MSQAVASLRLYGRVGYHLAIWVAAAACAVLLFLVGSLYVSGMRPVVVTSGSMTPTIPVGSLMISQKFDASRLKVGDVATATLPGKKLVTHRVVGIVPRESGVTEVWMKGDANEDKDSTPYVTDAVWMPKHVFPGVGRAFMMLRTPLGTLGIGCLIGFCLYLFSRNTKNRARTMVSKRANAATASSATDVVALPVLQQVSPAVPTAAEEAKRELAITAAVSHELRTPLTSIVGYLEMLTEGDMGKANKRQMKAMKAARRNAERLVDFVGDLNYASQIARGTMRAGDVAPIDVTGTVTDVMDALTATATEAGVMLRSALESDMEPIPGNACHLALSLRHIITNAISRSTASERRRVTVRAFSDGGAVTITVSDTGERLESCQADSLFDCFAGASLVDDTTSNAGIGLAVAKGIIDTYAGTISVDSLGDSGSTVTMKLPTSSYVPSP